MTIPTVAYSSDATYDPFMGILVATIGSRTLDVGETIKIATGSIVFRCAMDEYTKIIPVPRVSDPAAGKDLRIIAKTSQSITVDVGKSQHYCLQIPTGADNNGITWSPIYK